MVFPENLVLENERALLRPLENDDLKFLMPFAEQEPEIWAYSAVSTAGKEGMKNYITTAIHEKGLKKEYPFIIFDKHADSYAGSSRFYDINLSYLTTQLGFTWFGTKYQRTGLNRHCKMLMLTYAFEKWGMERVEFRADYRNERSIQAMKNIGCTVEGILRNYIPLPNGERKSSIVLSILRNEWFDTIKMHLQEKIH
jgi:RimJ/RimL family protein N-acetyltransferase